MDNIIPVVKIGQPIRMPKEITGVNDGVQMETVGVYTEFPGRKTINQKKVHCTVRASCERGVISIAFGDTGDTRQQIDVRIDELAACIRKAEASAAEQQ